MKVELKILDEQLLACSAGRPTLFSFAELNGVVGQSMSFLSVGGLMGSTPGSLVNIRGAGVPTAALFQMKFR